MYIYIYTYIYIYIVCICRICWAILVAILAASRQSNSRLVCQTQPDRYVLYIYIYIESLLEGFSFLLFPECVARVPVSLWGSGG